MFSGLDRITLAIFILIGILTLGVLSLLLFDIRSVPKAPVQTLGYLMPVHVATAEPLQLADDPLVVAVSPTKGVQTTQLVIDQIVVQPGDRILLMGQDDASENGIWEIVHSANGAKRSWRRCKDLRKEHQVIVGTLIYVTSGATNGDRTMVLQTSTKTSQPVSSGSEDIKFPSKHPGAFSIYVHIIPIMEMVLGLSSPSSTGSMLVMGPSGPEWSSTADTMHFSRVLFTEEWVVSDDMMSMRSVRISDDWIDPDSTTFLLLVIQVQDEAGDALQVMRYEVLTSSKGDSPRTVVLKKDHFIENKYASDSKPMSVVNVDGSADWWSEQEHRGVMVIGNQPGNYLARWFKLS